MNEELLAPGTRVGDFSIDEPIGRGSFGVVYRGRDERGHVVACKVARRPSYALLGSELAAQQNEIEILTRLNHPSMVGIRQSALLPDGRLCLVMEMVQGRTLRQYVADRGRLDVIEVVSFARRIAEALAYCHSGDVLHLDLKPENIMVVDPFEPAVKVLDFGLARLHQDWSAGLSTRVFGGTVAYLAPETFLGAEPTPARDLYALGTIMYELIVGRLPIVAATVPEMIRRKGAGDFRSLTEAAPDTPVALAQIVHALLAPDPETRQWSAATLAAKLGTLYYTVLAPQQSRQSVPPPGPAPSESISKRAAASLFVGRDRELGRILEAAPTGARQGIRPLLVLGDPGVGKSRLIAEALRQLPTDGMLVAFGRCRAVGEFVPYSALREILGQLGSELQRWSNGELRAQLASLTAPELELLCAVAPEFREMALPQAMTGGEDAMVEIGATEAVSRMVLHVAASLSSQVGLVLVCEDLQWADDGTANVLGVLAARTPPGLLLLTTSRTVPAVARDHFEAMQLEPLGSADTERLVSDLVGGVDREVVEALVDAVPLLRRGNPLVVRHVVRDLETAGYLRREEGGGVIVSPRLREEYRGPESVYSVIARHVERLNADAVAVLHVASLIDRQFLLSDLGALSLFSDRQIHAAVADACEALLCQRQGDVCAFTHDTVWEGLARLPGHGTPELHARIAQQLRARGAAPARVAHHLERSGQTLASALAYIEAAREAERLYDPRDAVKFLRRAIGLLTALPPEPVRDDAVVDAAHDVVRLAHLLGSVGETLHELQAGDAAVPEKTPRQVGAITSAYARVHYAQGDFARALDYSKRCLSVAPRDEQVGKYRHIPVNVIARAACGSGRFGPAIDGLRTGCELARSCGEYHELSHSQGLLGVALAFTGQFAEASVHVDAALKLALQLNDSVRLLGAHFYRAAAAEASFRWAEGVHATTALLSCAEQRKLGGLYLYLGAMFAGRHQFHLGRTARASMLLRNALHLGEKFTINLGVGWGHAFLGDVELANGRALEARLSYERAIEAAQRGMMDEYAASLGWSGMAHAAALLGEGRDAVVRAGEQAFDALRRVSNRSSLLVALDRQAQALRLIGEPDLAARLEEEKRALCAELGVAPATAWTPVRAPESNVAPTAPDAEETLSGVALLEALSTTLAFIPEFA
jgi:tetratricopeptide (TPR) repeat protein